MALRSFNIRKDVDVMIPLIQSAFYYPEHDEWSLRPDEIMGIADSFSLLSKLYPIFQIGGLFNSTLKGVMRGYIWEEEGRAVGLVNVSPMGLDSKTWIIGNVAVLPEYRRKGIARELIQAAVALAGQYQVNNLVLEVIAKNMPAVTLYEKKGFAIYNTIEHLNRPAALEAPALPALPEGYQIEKYHVGDWEARYTLMKNITPPAVQEYEPIDRKKFYKPPIIRLLRSIIIVLAPMKSTAYLVRHAASNAIVGRFAHSLRTKAGGVNEIEIDLDPKHAGLASYLVKRCVHDAVQFSPGRDIDLHVVQWQTDLLQCALDAGFVRRSEVYMMGMHLVEPQPVH